MSTVDRFARGYNEIYLSPHPDDVVFSCGGSVALSVQAGRRVLVATICSAAPPEGLAPSVFARELHDKWGLEPDGCVGVRTEEDAAALVLLGADRCELGFLDAIYRRPDLYISHATLQGPVSAADTLGRDLIRIVARMASANPNACFFAPLGVGLHVDHRAACIAGECLAETGRAVLFYEDVPYLLRGDSLNERLAALTDSHLAPTSVEVTSVMGTRLLAMAQYASQIKSCFGTESDMVHDIARASLGTAESRPGYFERFWRAPRPH